MNRIYKILIIILPFLMCFGAIAQEAKLQELEEHLKQAIDSKDNGKASFYSYEIAKLYSFQKQSDKAIEYLDECVAFGKKAGDNTLMYRAHEHLGLIYRERRNYNRALDNFQKALRYAKLIKQSTALSEMLIHIGTTYGQLEKHKKSIESLEEALSLALHQDDLIMQQRCYELLAEAYNKLGNSNKTKEYKNLYNNIVRSQQNEEKSTQQLQELKQKADQAGKEKSSANAKLSQQNKKLRQTEDSLLAIKYSLEATTTSLKETKDISEKQQLQIDLLSKDKELAEMRINEQNIRLENEALVRNSIVIGTFLAAALAGVVVNGYRKKIKANKKIEEQNKSIRSSINYAKRIQEAMFPKPELQKRLLPESFILLKPRDSVSGDFYWFTEIKNWYNPDVVFAAADCTGHGVPGAFMSMIGISALNGIIGQGIAESDLILNALDVEIRTALQQEMTKNNDGMDIALCIYRKEKNTLEFSGAKNPLIYIQNNKLSQIKGDVHSIGGRRSKSDHSFKKHKVSIEETTMVYLFSDGYADQFGGPNNTKFMSKKFQRLLLDIHQKPLTEQMELLNNTIEEWRRNVGQTDDILVMGIRLEPVSVV